jgi:PKD repeat protein
MKNLTTLIILLLPFLVFSQNHNHETCGTDYYHQEMFKQDKNLEQSVNAAMNKKVRVNSSRASEEVYIIPVVFHIIHQGGSENIPDKNVEDMMRRLNDDFRNLSDTSGLRDVFYGLPADIKVEFRLAQIDPNGNCTNGITHTFSSATENARDNVKSLIRWNTKNYFNVWVVKSIYNWSGTGTILGYATFPGGNASKDGVVMRADRVGYNATTLTHEVGHYLALYHTFQGGCSGGGDYVDDTPKESEAHYNCNAVNSCTDSPVDYPDMLENHMSYSSCRIVFTHGQKARMRDALENERENLWSEDNRKATGTWDENYVCKPVADFTLSNNIICSGNEITFNDNSFGSGTLSHKWYFEGGFPEQSNSLDPVINYSQPGKYTVKLVVESSGGKDSVVGEKIINVLKSVGNDFPIIEGFEDPNLEDNEWQIEAEINGVVWRRTNSSSYNGSYSLYVNNFNNPNGSSEHSFVMPPINLKDIENPYLAFTYAHASVSSDTRDQLRISISNNCAHNWTTIYFKNQFSLPTVSTQVTGPFYPTTKDLWKDVVLDFSNYTNDSNLLVKFTFNGQEGNNIFIDNLRITNLTSIQNDVQNNLSIYPNPVSDKIFIDFGYNLNSQVNLQIYDILGKQVYSEERLAENILELPLEETNITKNGIYIISIQFNNQTITKKITVNR